MSSGVKYTVAGIAVVALGFLTMGILHPKVVCQSQIDLNLNPERAFDATLDTALLKYWFSGFQSVKPLAGAGNQKGESYQIRLFQNDKQVEIKQTLLAVDPYNHLVFELETNNFSSVYDLDFTGDSTHSLLKVESYSKAKNIFLRSMFALSRPFFQQQQDSLFSRLKNAAEEKYLKR